MKKTSSNEYYLSHYNNIMTSGLIGFVVSLYHRHLEFGFNSSKHLSRVLELGAGNNEHLPFVRHSYDKYTLSDIRIELLQESIQKSMEITIKGNFEFKNPDSDKLFEIQEIDAEDLGVFSDSSFDRVIAGCLILHLKDPEKALREWRRVAKSGGCISIYIHSEPGMLLRFARLMSTSIRGKRMGIDHINFVYSEHKLHFLAIKYLINDIFSSDKVKFRAFPFPFLSWNFSLWKIAQIKIIK